AGVLDEDAAHGLGGGGEEVAAPLPVRPRARADQPQVGLVDQGGRLQRLARLLLSQALGGEAAQLVVDQRQQLGGGVRIALLDGGQDAGDLGHVSDSTGRKRRLETRKASRQSAPFSPRPPSAIVQADALVRATALPCIRWSSSMTWWWSAPVTP